MIIKNNINSFLAPFIKYYFKHPTLTFTLTIVAFCLVLLFCFIFAKCKKNHIWQNICMGLSIILLGLTLTSSLAGAWNVPSPIIYQPINNAVLPNHSIYRMVPGLAHSNLTLANQKGKNRYVLTSDNYATVNVEYTDYDTLKLKPVNAQGQSIIKVLQVLKSHADHGTLSLKSDFKKTIGSCIHNGEKVTVTSYSANPKKTIIKTH